MSRLTVISKLEFAVRQTEYSLPIAFVDLHDGVIVDLFPVEKVWYARPLNVTESFGKYFGLVLADTKRGDPVALAAQGSVNTQVTSSAMWVVK